MRSKFNQALPWRRILIHYLTIWLRLLVEMGRCVVRLTHGKVVLNVVSQPGSQIDYFRFA